ncbi:MAG: hypothetical protein COA31_011440 [Flavobacteriales bacterium]|nr:hypothetical protein [Flavobacteriales bacterium]
MMKEDAYSIEIQLENGLGDYYNNLVEKYARDKLETPEEEKDFLSVLEKLLQEDINLSDKLSLLNVLINIIDRNDIWQLIRVR